MSLMRVMDDMSQALLIEAPAEKLKVVEPPLGELSRVHELMGSTEVRESIRIDWHLSDQEMAEMSNTFEEIAILHDLLRPEDIRNVLDKRQKGMRDVIWRELFMVIHSVRQRNSNNRLDPMPPDRGSENFGEEVEKMMAMIDAKEPSGLISDQVTKIVTSSLRELYRQEQTKASEDLNKKVISPIKHVFDLQKAWVVVRESVEHPPIDGRSLTNLEQALRIIGEEQQPSWSSREIEEELIKNVRAITTKDLEAEPEHIQRISARIKKNLDKNPDDIQKALTETFGIVDEYVKLKDFEDFMSDPDYQKAVRIQLSRSGEVVPESLLYNRLVALSQEKVTSRIDNQVKELLNATGLKDKLTRFVNDPPHRRESLSKWREYVQSLLKRRSTEVRQAPIQELLKLYKHEGGQIALLEKERPELWQNIKRYIDMNEEAFGEDMSYLLGKMWEG